MKFFEFLSIHYICYATHSTEILWIWRIFFPLPTLKKPIHIQVVVYVKFSFSSMCMFVFCFLLYLEVDRVKSQGYVFYLYVWVSESSTCKYIKFWCDNTAMISLFLLYFTSFSLNRKKRLQQTSVVVWVFFWKLQLTIHNTSNNTSKFFLFWYLQ